VKVSPKALKRPLYLVLTFVLGMALFAGLANLGWLSPFGIRSESHDSQVIQAVERTQEISLQRLSIQGIKDENRNRTIFGKNVPGTSEKVFLQYNFKAKLGIDGTKVDVTKTGPKSYRISLPEFIFIGYDQPTFRTAATDGGVLSWFTPDIDKVKMINEILNDDARNTYIESNEEVLKEQAKVFYETLITSIEPAAVADFVFHA
jgi:hypothetical protein